MPSDNSLQEILVDLHKMKTEEIIMLIAKIAPSFEEIENRDVRMYTIMCTFNLLTLQVQFLRLGYRVS